MTTLPFLLAVALKGLVVLALAALATWMLRRAPASARHSAWAAAFGALLLLPVLEAVGPAWSVSVLPATVQVAPLAPLAPAPPAPPALPLPPAPALAPMAPPAPPAVPAPPSRVPDAALAAHDAERAAYAAEIDRQHAAFDAEMAAFDHEMAAFEGEIAAFAAEQAAVSAEAAALALEDDFAHVPTAVALRTTPQWAAVLVWAVGLWGLGALLVSVGWLVAFMAARRLVRAATPETDEEWGVLFERARRLTGLGEGVRLLRSETIEVPIAWGFGVPAVVLPASADTWSEDRREAVLLHEMAHLRRRDAWTQVLAQAALALHWMNPLAWVGYHRFLNAREQACDDAVLQGGARPSAYAEHLVSVARGLRRETIALAAVAPMARCAPLESRIRSILDPSRQRRPLGRPALGGTVGLALLVVVPLAAVRPVAQTAPPTAWVHALDEIVVEAPEGIEIMEAEIEAEVEAALADVARLEARPLPDVLEELGALDERDVLEAPDALTADAISATVVEATPVHTSKSSGVCVDHLMVKLKRSGLDAEGRDRLQADLAALRLVAQGRQREARAAWTARLSALERSAPGAPVVARRVATAASLAPRPSLPPGVAVPPRPSAPRVAPADTFDWGAVDRARRAALTRAR